MRAFFTGLLLLTLTAVWAQRNCSTMDVLAEQLIQNPALQQQMQAIEQHNDHYHDHQHEQVGFRAVVTIPVVFHIIHNGDAVGSNENISDALILAQLQQLNDDFRKMNTDAGLVPSIFQGVHADTEIQFCLAQRKPDGTATNGINRVQFSQATWTSSQVNSTVKPATIWDRNQYLNVWSVAFGGGSSGLLGYAQFPGGAASTDGTVVAYYSVGSLSMVNPGSSTFGKGRTLTHEVGHWLNLRHIWGDATCGNDLVADTPVHNTSNGGCPNYPHLSTCTGTPIEMTMNYMDYTYDACMYMFSLGQKARMQAVFASGGPRFSITTSNGCVPPETATCGTPAGLNATGITTSGATLNWTAVSGATSYNVQYRLTGTTTWTTVSTPNTSYTLSGLASSSTYQYQIQANCNGTLGTYSAISTFTTNAETPTCGIPTGLNATNVSSTGATLNWNAVSGATTYNVQYRLQGTTTWTTVPTLGTSYVLTGLSASSTYEFQVQANCNGTPSAYSAIATFTTSGGGSGCGTPSGLSATGITQNSATLSWNFVSGANSYNLQYRQAGTTTWTTINTFSNTYLLTGLNAATTYEFQVQTVCKSSISGYSAISTFTTSSGGASCGTPTGLNATNITTNSATLNWSAVSGATSYNVQYRLAGTTTWTTMTSASTSYNATGLAATSTYEFQVQANCSGTLGTYSAIATFTTNSPAPTCGTPGGLNATNVTANSATLNWNTVSGATSYNVQYRLAGTTTWSNATSAVNSYNVSGLSASSTYEFQVQANCNGTLGTYSAIATFTTSAGGGGACTDTYEPNESQFAGANIPVNQTVTALISSGTDSDWFRFNNTSNQPNIRIDLTSLPANYDVELYLFSLLGSSNNPGTANESIVFNTSTVRAYYIHVYGNNGAFDPNDCYELSATISSTPLREQLDEVQLEETPDFVLFPNPASTEIMIDMLTTSETPTEIAIYDVSGRLVKRQTQQFTAEATMTTIDISDLAPSVYTVRVKNGEINSSRKLVVNR